MGKYFGLIFFTIQLLKITAVQAFIVKCNASLQTVTNVAGCPTNETLYQIAARQKNCSSLPLDSGSCVSFEYHCVLSEDLKTAIEVCAPSLNVIGYSCAMFSNTLQSIMRVDNMTCGNKTEGCPFSYNSTTSYKYQQCFPTESRIPITEATQRTSNLENDEDTRQSSNEQKLVKIVVPLGVAVLVIGGVLIFCFIWRNKRRQVKLQNAAGIKMDEINVHENNRNTLQEIQQRHENEKQPLIPQNESQIDNQSEEQKEKIDIDLDAFTSNSNKKPAYKVLKTREMSFNGCDDSMKLRAKEFARDGFYYEGYGRATTCFHCDFTKSDWKSEDEIHLVHLQAKGDCKYIQFLQSNNSKTD